MPQDREERASEIQPGDVVAEYGMDAVKVAERQDWGDRVLIRTADGTELSYDCDEVVRIEREVA